MSGVFDEAALLERRLNNENRRKRKCCLSRSWPYAVTLSVKHAGHRVTIIPRAVGALGHTSQLPTEERFPMARSELLAQLTYMLAGRQSFSLDIPSHRTDS
jgi:cell division protease FtsH